MDLAFFREITMNFIEKITGNLFVKRRLIWLLGLLLVLGTAPAMAAANNEKSLIPEKKWSAELRVKRYFGSHTSYEFGNPFPPYQAPLSRLEFPMNTWWAGGEVRRSFSRFSTGVEVLTAIPMESDGLMKDSDWDDDSAPGQRTIYSESQCRMEPSYRVRGDVDMKVGDWLGMPVWFDLRPVAGVRWQRLTLVAHDGAQTELGMPSMALPGDSIRFQQTYWQYFLGIRAAYDLERHLKAPRLKLHGQLDWAYVDGDNSDHHLLRMGNRMTYEKTRGDAWHASLGLKVGLTENINAGAELEYLRIRSEGSHQLVNDLFGIDFSFDHGVKVWSDQFSMMMSLEYLF
jgi:outer membrane protease